MVNGQQLVISGVFVFFFFPGTIVDIHGFGPEHEVMSVMDKLGETVISRIWNFMLKAMSICI